MHRLSRRQFVAAASAILLAPGVALAQGPVTGFAATSGRRVAGLLTTATPDACERALQALKARLGYRRPLTYASTDRRKADYAQAAIEYAAGENVRFTWIAATRRGAPEVAAVRDGLIASAGGVTMARKGDYPALAELAAFLTGCAYGEVANAAHPLKRTLIDARKAGGGFIA